MKKNHREHIEKLLRELPKTPGVYQMKSEKGEVLYVGKAKSLKNRVSSYFVRESELSLAKRQMVHQIADIETISCQTEVEALVLETNLIKHLTPKYNILMKDDKNLAYIKITNAPVPEVIKTRQKFDDGGTYFGPFPSGVETALRTLKKIFKIRNCRVKFAQKKGENITITDKAGKTIPCMDYYIGICPGPCLLTPDVLKNHDENIIRFSDFFSGKIQDVLSLLEDDMKEKARNLEFEKAQEIKDSLLALRSLHERQIVRDGITGNFDIFVMYEKYDNIYIGFTRIKEGKIVGVSRYEVDLGIEEKSDSIARFLLSEYIDNPSPPDRILFGDIELTQELELFLKEKKITSEFPKIGPKKELLDFTLRQVREFAYKNELKTLENTTLSKSDMQSILHTLSYAYPQKKVLTFECYDISHTDGHFTYASRVVMENGKMVPKKYKKYKIRSLQDGVIDDFASHREVMRRRTLESLDENNPPDLIIIDGGKGQLSSALLGIQDALAIQLNPEFTQHICSLAKREEEVFVPGTAKSIIFSAGTGELMVLQKLRDESHRFSLSANKSVRMKSMKKNILEQIPGIGPKTRKKLLSLAGNVDAITALSPEELEKVCTQKQIQTLKDHGIVH